MPSTASSKKPKPAPKPKHEWTFSAIGTSWWIGIYQKVTNTALAKLQKDIQERIVAFDTIFSRFRDDSIVSTIARRPGTYDFGTDGAVLLALYRQLYDATGGLVTPLIGQTIADAGYDATYRLRAKKRIKPAPAWDDVIGVNGPIMTVNQPILLDFGAAGKGYLVDILCELLAAHGIKAFCVDGSGDMRAQGIDAPLLIGLEHPVATDQVIGVAQLQQAALCGSAGNRRAWGTHHHIMHPRTTKSVDTILATWVVADTAALADGLATALFFVEPAALLQQFAFSYCSIDKELHSSHSANFPATLFTST